MATMGLGILLLALCTLCALTTTNPLYGGDKSQKQLKFSSQPCFPYGDRNVLLYSRIGCSMTYQAETNCLLVQSCPEDAPTNDEELMKAWLVWKMYKTSNSNHQNVTGERQVSLFTKKIDNISTTANTNVPDVHYNNTNKALNSGFDTTHGSTPVTSPSTTSTSSSTTESTTSTTSTTTTSTTTTSTTTTTTTTRAPTKAPTIQSTPCLRYRRTALSLYRRMGCTVSYGLGCSMVKNCPTECHDSVGRGRKLSSGSWFEGKRICSCENIRHVRAFVPQTPRRGTPYPPFKNCATYGCFVPDMYEYISPGESIMLFNGTPCTCKHGPDPEVQDDAPPFHLSCQPIR